MPCRNRYKKILLYKACQESTKSPQCDFEPRRDQRVELDSGATAPQGAAPSARTRQKKKGERRKQRKTKKERVRKVEKDTGGI